MDEQKETEIESDRRTSLFARRVLADYKAQQIVEQKILDTLMNNLLNKKEPKPRGSI